MGLGVAGGLEFQGFRGRAGFKALLCRHRGFALLGAGVYLTASRALRLDPKHKP